MWPLVGNTEIQKQPSDSPFDGRPGAFDNVNLPKELPQIGEALLRNDTSALVDLIKNYNIKYFILFNGTQEADFLVKSNLSDIYHENWQTIVLAIK